MVKNKYLIVFVLLFLCLFSCVCNAAVRYPKYAEVNQPYVEINGNKPFFKHNEYTARDIENYAKLDRLGRCGVAYAVVSQKTMPTEERGTIGYVTPSGWNQAKYEGLIDSTPPYLFNRCHLIGYQLAGENANEKNLITGTRYMNIEGMLPFENKVADYIRGSASRHVMYRVTPVFEGNNLVASGVLMEASSVEDKGKGLAFCVFCYNVQPGVDINYADGSSKVCEKTTGSSSSSVGFYNNKSTSKSGVSTTTGYIVNTNTGRFHHVWCESVKDIKEKNKASCSKREEAIAAGYVPCKRGNP